MNTQRHQRPFQEYDAVEQEVEETVDEIRAEAFPKSRVVWDETTRQYTLEQNDPQPDIHTSNTTGAGEFDDSSPRGPEVDPSEPFRWALELILILAVFLEAKWVAILSAWLPLALELMGRYEAAEQVLRVLETGHPQRAGLVGATGVVAAAVVAVVGAASWAILSVLFSTVLNSLGHGLVTTAGGAWFLVVAVLWEPCWWATFPFAFAVSWQRRIWWARPLSYHVVVVWMVAGAYTRPLFSST